MLKTAACLHCFCSDLAGEGQECLNKSRHFCNTQYGLVTIIAAFVGVLGLPVFASHTWAGCRYLKAMSAARRGIAPGSRSKYMQA